MKLKYIILFLSCFFFASVSAQTLDQARSMFTRGEYSTAKPVFERHLKSQPNNANYNYWYGVCCLKTGEAETSIKHLEMATKRKVQNAPLYLGQAYDMTYRFEEAVDMFEEYIEGQAKRRQSTEETLVLLERSKANARMLKGVEDVCVIDSFVVNKATFLTAYRISEESGKIYTYNDYFDVQGNNEGTVYETELGNLVYYSKAGKDNTLNIFSKSKMLDEWSEGKELPGIINAKVNANYPFVLTDGITLYFAANSTQSMGGYDIFVTRYNSGTESYLAPENAGMPFNSPFNDYMYVVDEFNNLGWFASDRNQPEGKVCIYVFIPNTSRKAYNYEAMDQKKLRQLAQLNSIKDTWKDKNVVEEGKKRLAFAMSQMPKEGKVKEFTFIVNDQYTYHNINDFKSNWAQRLYKKYQLLEDDYKKRMEKLTNQRDEYAKANKSDKDRMAPSILDLEKRTQEMERQLNDLAIEVRSEEIRYINK